MKDIKRELLTFLYERRTSLNHVSINHVFKHTELRPIDIKNLLGQLKASGIIKINKDYTLLGSSNPPRPRGSERHIKTTEDIPLTAMLTHEGERFVLEHYLKADQPTINAGQLVYAHGNINAPINQSDNHSLNLPVNPTQIKNRPQIINTILTIIGIVLAAISAYIAYLQL